MYPLHRRHCSRSDMRCCFQVGSCQHIRRMLEVKSQFSRFPLKQGGKRCRNLKIKKIRKRLLPVVGCKVGAPEGEYLRGARDGFTDGFKVGLKVGVLVVFLVGVAVGGFTTVVASLAKIYDKNTVKISGRNSLLFILINDKCPMFILPFHFSRNTVSAVEANLILKFRQQIIVHHSRNLNCYFIKL